MDNNQQNQSYRKPCRPKIEGDWWYKSRYYLFYIVRESTAFFMLWISIVLMYGAICAHSNPMGEDEFYRFIFFLQHPIVIGLNILALLAALLHSITWFSLAPKATNLIVSGKKVPAWLLISSLWIVTIIVSVVLLMLVQGDFR